MKIKNTSWQTIAVENPNRTAGEGVMLFGYEARATQELLDALQQQGIGVELVNKNKSAGRFEKFILPNNHDRQNFAKEQYFRVLSRNTEYKTFEKMLEQESQTPLPEDRFDEYIQWTNRNVWKEIHDTTNNTNKRGYALSLENLSPLKQDELKEHFKFYQGQWKQKRNEIWVTEPEWVKTLEFEWKMAKQSQKYGTNVIDLGELEPSEKSPSIREKLKKTADNSVPTMKSKNRGRE